MTEKADPKPPIRLGVDLGDVMWRVAYALPTDPHVTVHVPLISKHFRPIFPLTEPLSRKGHRWFPGVFQRLHPDFSLVLYGKTQPSNELVRETLRRAIEVAEEFSGSSVESVLAAHPTWMDEAGRRCLADSFAADGMPRTVLCSDAEAACALFQNTEMAGDERATVLVVTAGYTGTRLSLLRATPKRLRLLATESDQRLLAGNLLDYVLLAGCLAALGDRFQKLVPGDPEAVRWVDLQYRIQLAKEGLRDDGELLVTLPPHFVVGDGPPPILRIDRGAFETIVKSHLSQVRDLVVRLLGDADVPADEVRYVLLEGGSTGLPGVEAVFAELFPSARIQRLPREAVAKGAALLVTDSYAADDDRDNSLPNRAARELIPQVEPPDGLVSLVEPLPEPAQRPTEPPFNVERLTLADIRRDHEAGDFAAARARIASLRAALDDLERTLDNHAPPTLVRPTP
jgi:hypothetical protein